MKKHIKTIMLVLFLTASVAACKKKGSGGGGGGGIGVPECDDGYFAKMDACAKKLAKQGGEQLTKMANMMRGAWKEDAADPEKKKGLAKVCTDAVKDMAKQFPDCDWGVAAEPTEGSGSSMAGSGSGMTPDQGSGGGMAGSGSGMAPDQGSAEGSGSAAAPAGSGSANP